MDTASVIHEGNSQLVRLPDGYHLNAATVAIRHDGDAIVLEPLKPAAWPEGFFDAIQISDPSFGRPAQGELSPVKSA